MISHPEDLDTDYVILPEKVLLATGFVDDAAIAIEGETISWVGPRDDLPPQHRQHERHDLPGHAVIPGFVDAHQHLTQSFGSTFAYGEPSEIFRRVWLPLEQSLTEEELTLSAELAAFESMRGGFTAVAEAGTRSSHDVGLIADVARRCGLRTVLGLICHDVGPDAASADDVIRRAEQHLSRYEHDPWVVPSLAVAVPEMATDKTLHRLARLCEESGAVLQSHVNEHLASVERSLLAEGRRPLERLDAVSAVGPWLLAAHAVLLTPQEMMLLRDRGAAWSYNPVASSWKGNAIADALTMLALGVRTGLGTDGTRGDGFRLMDAAETAARFASAGRVGDPFAGEGRAWLDAATRGGADAIGMADTAGTIRPGAPADFLVLDLRVPELTPSHDLAWDLVRTGNRDQLRAVVTAGRPRIIDGRLVGSDQEDLLQRASAAAHAATSRAGLRARRQR
ncbi:MAG TPA: amidohydrolase family protein [Flexivirga sp.]|uniref:amidohydrolase family protein n=1 Tax=Flexivirga sp. TaxID=1962927 RepID=UPI002C1680D1|nr:amidohydrolase family protein [Flexivirga sp.]HWC24412.1 amidohydrolase family protein [Flexivirga sp.]